MVDPFVLLNADKPRQCLHLVGYQKMTGGMFIENNGASTFTTNGLRSFRRQHDRIWQWVHWINDIFGKSARALQMHINTCPMIILMTLPLTEHHFSSS